MTRYFFFVLSALLITSESHAQSTTNTADGWYGFFGKTGLGEHSNWWTETQLRFDFNDRQMQQILVRTGYLHSLDKHEFGLLYAYIQSGDNKEHRLALQHSLSYGEFIGADFSHRIRLELRTFEDGVELAERFRYLLRAQQSGDARWKYVVWNEIFLNLIEEPSTGNQWVDRNRLFMGTRVKVNDNLNLEVGYLNQFVPRNAGNTMEHILTTYLFF